MTEQPVTNVALAYQLISQARRTLAKARQIARETRENRSWLSGLLTGAEYDEAAERLISGVERYAAKLESQLASGTVRDLTSETWVLLRQAEKSFKVLDSMNKEVTGESLYADFVASVQTTFRKAGEVVSDVARTAGEAAGSIVGGALSGLGLVVVLATAVVIYVRYFRKG